MVPARPDRLQSFVREPAVQLRGAGLHSGRACRARIRPAAPGQGLRLNGALADLDAVTDGRFATTLRTAGGPVSTVEHLLAALFGAGVLDAEIDVEGGEVPILDGSAAPWLALLPPPAAKLDRPAWRLARPVRVELDGAVATAEPAACFEIDVRVDFPGLGPQRYRGGLADFAADIAPARTFGFRRDEAALRAAGRIAGVSWHNAVVFADDGAVENPGGLRFPDEPVRHKALDLIGDLALLGALPHARIRVDRGGHRLHHRLARALRRAGSAKSP